MLLAVWADVGEHMRRYLEAATLADIVTMAQGEAAWPGDGGTGARRSRLRWAGSALSPATTAARSAGRGDSNAARSPGRVGWSRRERGRVQHIRGDSGSTDRRPPVAVVAHDGMTDGRHVHPDLMGAARLQPALEQGTRRRDR